MDGPGMIGPEQVPTPPAGESPANRSPRADAARRPTAVPDPQAMNRGPAVRPGEVVISDRAVGRPAGQLADGSQFSANSHGQPSTARTRPYNPSAMRKVRPARARQTPIRSPPGFIGPLGYERKEVRVTGHRVDRYGDKRLAVRGAQPQVRNPAWTRRNIHEQRPPIGDRRSERRFARSAEVACCWAWTWSGSRPSARATSSSPTSWPRRIPTSASCRSINNPEKALELVAQLRETSPECSIVVISSSTDGNLILRAMRAGVKEFLTQPVRIEDLVAALERISEQRFGRGERKPRQHGDRRGRRDRRRRHDQPGREPGLRPGRRSAQLRGPGRPRPVPGRRRRVPRHDSRLHAGRRGPERHAARLHAAQAVAHEALLGPVPAAAARAAGRRRP